jgi:hypothetical protein
MSLLPGHLASFVHCSRLCLKKRAPSLGFWKENFGTPTKPVPLVGTGFDFFRVTWWGARDRVLLALFGCNLGIAHLVAPSPLSTIEGISTVEAPALSGNVEHNQCKE